MERVNGIKTSFLDWCTLIADRFTGYGRCSRKKLVALDVVSGSQKSMPVARGGM